MKFKTSCLVSLYNLRFNFSLFCEGTLRKHYIIKVTWSAIQKKIAFNVRTHCSGYKNKRSKDKVEKVAILATLLHKW